MNKKLNETMLYLDRIGNNLSSLTIEDYQTIFMAQNNQYIEMFIQQIQFNQEECVNKGILWLETLNNIS